MKDLTLLILILLMSYSFAQKPIKKLTYHEDTLQVMSWTLGLDYKTAKDQGIIKDEYVWKTDCDVIINLVAKTVTYYYVPEKRVEHVFKLKKFKTTKTSYFFEFEVGGYYQDQKVLICEMEDGSYSSITQYALSIKDKMSAGNFDRNVTVKVE